MLIDSHAHLELFEDLEEVLVRAKEEGVSKIITIGTSLETSRRAIQIAEYFSSNDLKIYATCGIHPNDGAEEVENLGLVKVIKALQEIAKSSNKVVGVGECGLDYLDKTTEDEKKIQRKLFGEQIKLASNLKLPLVVHCRNGWSEIFDLISKHQNSQSEAKGVFHSFTGGVGDAVKATNLGFYVSFSGIVTFGNAKNIADAAKNIKTDRILLETDSPFLAPEPIRGSQNEPKSVRIIGQFLAEHLKLPIGKIEKLTTNNANNCFRLS